MVPGLGFRIIACNNFSIRSNEFSLVLRTSGHGKDLS